MPRLACYGTLEMLFPSRIAFAQLALPNNLHTNQPVRWFVLVHVRSYMGHDEPPDRQDGCAGGFDPFWV